MSRNEHFLEEVASKDWFHGTDSKSADDVAQRQRADFRGIQVHGPGFYVTPNEEHAKEYAKSKGTDPVVQSGIPMVEKGVSLSHRELSNIGSQFRKKNPNVSGLIHDAALGNIRLRQKGYDFLHVNEGAHGDPIDVGVILRPNKWLAMEDRGVTD